MEVKELDYHRHGKLGNPTGSLAIIKAIRFWIREDAVNEEMDQIDLSVMRPLTQLGWNFIWKSKRYLSCLDRLWRLK
jgi:hypothetical protein